VFLDEFQDCTNTQFSLIRAAFEGTDILLTAVGDTKQRIMGWAGALEGIFKKFADQFGALGLNLYQNFRSAPRLRRMQNAMIKVMEPKAALKPAEIQGAEGEIDVLPFDDNYQEAQAIADLIQGWIQNDGLPPAEIGVLVPRQVEEYAELLMPELEARGIPFRNEQNLQDLSVEPIARVIVDFLLVIFGDREPDAYARLMDTVAMTSNDDEGEGRSRFQQYVDEERTKQNGGGSVDADSITTMIREAVRHLGPEAVLSLSSEYEQGTYLKQVIEQTVDRIHTLWKSTNDLGAALARFSEDRSVRIMTIHKSKGLEFHSVIMLAIENETYWAEATTERSIFFVGISRAKQRLLLTWSKQRPTPSTKPRRWNTARTPHEEFLGYADTP
jgi:superfamily I DNA/RNA helicase